MGFADDYIDVATRIADFRAKHPEGSIQPANLDQPYRIEEIGGKTFIVYAAAAYRTPDDLRPGIGLAWEPFPGASNFTRNSELMNAETSAVGRAIVNALAGDTKKSVASADEVRNRQADRDVQVEKPRRPAKKAERGPVPADADPWSAPSVEDAPPPPPDTRVTDQQWFDGWLARVIEVADPALLLPLREEAAAKYREGKVTKADAEQVAEALRQQAEVIERATPEGGWPPVAKVPGSDEGAAA